MPFPSDLEYTDLDLRAVRLSQQNSFFQDGIGSLTTMDFPLDFSAVVTSVPLSNGRMGTFYLQDHIDGVVQGGTYEDNTINYYQALHFDITRGTEILSQSVINLPATSVPHTNPYLAFGSLNYAVSAAAAGDHVVFGAALFDLTNIGGASPKWYGASWLLLFDCSSDTPSLADQYLREAYSNQGDPFPYQGSVEIILAPLDDTRVVVSMLPPTSTTTEQSIFAIKVDGGSLNFQDNGYPLTYGDWYTPRLGYDPEGDVGLAMLTDTGDTQNAIGFHINAAGTSINYGTPTYSWDFEGYTYFGWGSEGRNVASQIEEGVFYAPVYAYPDFYAGNPVLTAKFRYTGSGAPTMLDVSPPLPHPDFAAQIIWSSSSAAWWNAVEYGGGKVVTACSSGYYDGVDFYEDLWLIDDTFGSADVYRVANISNAGDYSSHTDYEVDLWVSGGFIYMGTNAYLLFDSPEFGYANENTGDYGSAILMCIVNFNVPDIDGGLDEQRRQFWRNRPGY